MNATFIHGNKNDKSIFFSLRRMTNDCSKSTVFLNYPKRSHFIHKSEVVSLQNSSEFHNLQNLFCKMRSFWENSPHCVLYPEKKRINGSKSFGFLFYPKSCCRKVCVLCNIIIAIQYRKSFPHIYFFPFSLPVECQATINEGSSPPSSFPFICNSWSYLHDALSIM